MFSSSLYHDHTFLTETYALGTKQEFKTPFFEVTIS
jgi:hypothetical protein